MSIYKKLKVFLSSSQFQSEFAIEREGLPVFFARQPLTSMFDLWRIEDNASPEKISQHYIQNVKSSDVLIVLLGQTLRPAVKEEYRAAIKAGKPVFGFLKQCDIRNPDMDEFIATIRNECTTTDYNSFQSLCSKLESSLLSYCISLVAAPKSSSKQIPSQTSTESPPDERPLRLLVGILGSDAAAITKERVIETYVLESLLPKDSKCSADEISRHISTSTQLPLNQISPDIEQAIIRLRAQIKILPSNNSTFTLAADTRASLVRNSGEADTSERDLFARFYSRHKAFFDQVAIADYQRIIKDAVSDVIYRNAIALASSETKGDTNPIPFDADELNREVTVVLGQIPETASDISRWQPAVIDILKSDDPSVVQWLHRLQRAYWSLATLGLDPDCAALKKDHIKTYNVFLDSHILLRAMVQAGNDAVLCKDLIERSIRLDVPTFISFELFEEIHRSFGAADRTVHSVSGDVQRAAAFYEKLDRHSDIFDGFIKAKQTNKLLTWESYINRFYSPMDSRKLKNYVEAEMGVSVFNEGDRSPERIAHTQELADLLLASRGKTVIPPPKSMGKSATDWQRQYQLRTNEARQMALIYDLRTQADGVPPKQYWFVTFDTFVYDVSTSLAKSADDFYRFPCYIKPARWLEMLQNVDPTHLPTNVFREVLLSETVQHAADLLEQEVIAQMLEERVDQHIKDVQTLHFMLSDIVNRPAVQDAYERMMSASNRDRLSAADKVKEQIIGALRDELITTKAALTDTTLQVAQAQRVIKKAKGKEKYLKAELKRRPRKKS